ncbi:MAG: HAD family phosphatase [Chloroflexi bacterium]|nr:HAD family phosphatase [Chloroflexota bacterium]
MNDSRVRAIFFDLGMVLITFDWNIAVARFAARGVAPERVRAFLADPLHDIFERNEITSQEFFQRGKTITGFDGPLDEFRTYWNEIFETLTANVARARELAQSYPLYIISNTNPWHLEYVETKFRWLNLFRERFYSPAFGIRKPDPRLFEIALTRAGIAPHNALFLDDRLENIHAARQIGMNTLHVPTPEIAQSELAKLVAQTRARTDRTVH